MGIGDKIRIAAHIEVEWLETQFAPAVCPNCGTAAPVQQYLDIDYHPPNAKYRFILQICPHCTARFVDNTHMMDYAADELIRIGWNIYQSQLGAGIWPISAPLTRIEKPAGSRVLEIGGAYGFGLDFCIQARGWVGEGYDPSPLADFGARELGLAIEQGYFETKDLSRGPWDVVIATELIEHLEHPPEFLVLMRQAISADGILLLTTPDAEWITPALEADGLVSLLSPDAHLVLQTEKSLKVALANAGFEHVVVLRESMSLVAYASAAPFMLNGDEAAARAMYRHYLVERGKLTAPTSDLRFGFAGRGLFEAANDGDHASAEAAWAALQPAAMQRFGLDLAAMENLPPGADDASLAELSQLIPLGLGMILFGRVMHLLGAGTDRAVLLPMLRNAGVAVAALQSALAKRSLTDGLSANIGKIIEREILLCLAEAGDNTCVPDLVALGDTVAGWRGFVALVNTDALDLARKLKEALLPDMPAGDLPHDLQRNILLSLANFALTPGGETMRVFDYACALRELGQPNDDIILAAFTRLVNNARYEEALNILATYDIDLLARQAAVEKNGQDARLAQMVLDLAVGDPAEIPHRLDGLEIDPERRDVLLLEAFIRLVNASRYDEALGFIRDYNIPALAELHGGEAGRNARLARMVLDLAVGDPAEIPRRLNGLEIEPARRDVLLLEAFIRLVNASRYDEALGFIRDYEIPALAERSGGEAGRNARLARMVLDLAVGDPAEIPRHLDGVEIEPARRDVLLLEAFIRLVNASRYDEALGFIRDYEIPALAERSGGEAGRNARLAGMVLDLAVGDPAEIPQRLDGLEIEPARRDVLLLEAFIRLVNGSRFHEALAFAEIHGVAALGRQHGEDIGGNTAIALAVVDLAVGDPARVPGHLDGAEVALVRRDELLLGAFTGLVNTARYDEAETLAGKTACFRHLAEITGKAADDARVADVMLDLQRERTEAAVRKIGLLAKGRADAAMLDGLYVDSFVRLVNEGKFAAAHGLAQGRAVERRLAGRRPELRHDALAALLMLELQPGGSATRIPQRLEEALQGGLDEERVQKLALVSFVTLVNAADSSTARLLLHLVEPILIKLQPPYDEAARNALFAAGILFLEERDDWRRSTTIFARLRDALVKRAPPGTTPDALFWPAMRGEVLALHRLNRSADATALLEAFIGIYPDAPDDLLKQIESHNA